jgi:AcrR family transcriptional regulator
MAAAAPWGGLSPEGGADTDASTSCRPWREARERLLDTAAGLFYARGIRAVGVDTIIAASGVAKATFYKHFPAKEDLVLAYLDRVDEGWTAQLREAAAAAGEDPRERLVGLFDALSTASERQGYRGCGFLNAAAESTPGSPVHARAVAHKRAVRDWVEELAQEAGADDPRGLACSLTLLLDGGLANGALDADPAAARSARRSAEALVRTSTPAAG